MSLNLVNPYMKFAAGATPDVTISLATDAGWYDNGSADMYWSANKLNFPYIRRSTTAQYLVLDVYTLLGSVNFDATEWTVRFGQLETLSLGSLPKGTPLFMCVSNGDSDSGTLQDALALSLDYSSTPYSNNISVYATDNGSFETGVGRVVQGFSTDIENTAAFDHYIELKKTSESGTDNLTVNIYEDEYVTLTATRSVTQTIENLHYLKFINDSEQNNANVGAAEITGSIQIWNGSSP